MNSKASRPRSFRRRVIRRCLSQNEIWFKTFAATLLSLMAIAVGVAQAITSRDQMAIAKEQKEVAIQQKQLVELQTKIAEANALPKFTLRIRQEINQSTGHTDNNHLIVEKHGGDIHKFLARVAYFLSVEVGIPNGLDGKSVYFSGRERFPVRGYFTAAAMENAGTGVLTTMVGFNNNAVVGKIEREARQLAQDRHWDFANVDEHIFVYLQYLDLLDRQHDDYYSVAPIYGGSRINDTEGKEIFAQ